MFKGLLQCVLGLGLLILCVSAFAAWWGLCFGSVIIGVVLLLCAPHILLLPWPIGAFGLSFLGSGIDAIKNR
jgi:hypothetical protein